MVKLKPAQDAYQAYKEWEKTPTGKIIKQLQNPKKAQQGLMPIGNSPFYMTPSSPASPTDCNRYPDSPFCGGNPLSNKIIDLSVDLIVDNCNIGMQINPTLGFIKLPPTQIVYRSPGCRQNNNTRKERTAPNQPETEYIGTNCELAPQLIMIVPVEYVTMSAEIIGKRDCGLASFSTGQTVEISNIEYPYKGNVKVRDRFGGQWTPVIRWTAKTTAYQAINGGDKNPITNRCEPNPTNGSGTITQDFYFSPEAHQYPGYEWQYCHASIIINYTPIGGTTPVQHVICAEKRGIIMTASYFINTYRKQLPQSSTSTSNTYYSTGSSSTKWKHYFFCPNPNTNNPPIPYLPMSCCPPPNDDLLKAILKKLEGLEDTIGIKQYPAKLPKRLVYPKGNGQEECKTLTDLLAYQVKQIDKAVGYFPQKIKVADTNPTQKGNQSVELEIHSIADFLRELLQVILDVEGDGDATNNMLVRCLYELGFIHQGVVQGDAMLDAICEALDFKQKWKTVKVPFAFDPYAGQKGKVGQGFDKQKNAAQIDKNTEQATEDLIPYLLQNTEVSVRILENTDKKSLNDILQEIKKYASTAAAAVSEPASGDRLEKLVEAAQVIIQLQNAIDRKNARQAMAGGDLRTRKENK